MIKAIIKLYHTLSTRKYDTPFLLTLLLFESILSLTILKIIPYTEIDWKAYMEEVTTFQNGEMNYINIKGSTGPLVYPGGFLYLYSLLKTMSDGGKDVYRAQCLFVILYILNSFVVLVIYTRIVDCQRKRTRVEKLLVRSISGGRTKKQEEHHYNDYHHHNHNKSQREGSKVTNTIWSWRIGMILLCFSKRIHSIFILRLFNDAPCMLLFYISVYFFIQSYFRIGCIFFSLAVSIKMNVLLFAPGLLLLLMQYNKSWVGTLECLSICAVIQVLLGLPFLLTYPVSYIRKAFEFDRVFFFKWTVNWKFLQEDVFTSKPLSILLLLLHITTLIFFASKWIQATKLQLLIEMQSQINRNDNSKHNNNHHNNTRTKAFFLGQPLNPTYVVYTLFTSNFIGIVFARTLHYQFYSWYFHSLPLLLWMTALPILTKVVVMGLIEYAFNVFPATPMSSASLQFAHFVLLISLWKADVPIFMTQDDHHDGGVTITKDDKKKN